MRAFTPRDNPIRWEDELTTKTNMDFRTEFRAEAEALVARSTPATPRQPGPEILHELEVRKVELEMQNEELRRTVVAVTEALDRYNERFDHAPVGFVTIDREGTISEVNAPVEPLLGLERRSIHGKKMAAFLDPNEADRWHLAFNKALKHGEKLAMEVKLRRPDGTHAFSWLQLIPATEREEPIVRVAVSDVTELKLAEEALRDSQAKLAVASRLAGLGTLVAGVSHEINNPLTATISDTQMALETLYALRNRLGESAPTEVLCLEAVIEGLKDALEGGRRIEQIVKDLQTFGQTDAERTRVRLIDIVEHSMRWLPVSIARTATVVIENASPPDVVAAFGQIEQVLVNLITNAAKALRPKEHGKVVVRLVPSAEGKARVEVIDNGKGIDPALRSRIFDPFFTTGDIGEGMGLGLSISHAIVTSHGGTLTVESEVGKGSTFRVELPAAPVEA
jgi:PAS domain S-box-containing protein